MEAEIFFKVLNYLNNFLFVSIVDYRTHWESMKSQTTIASCYYKVTMWITAVSAMISK